MSRRKGTFPSPPANDPGQEIFPYKVEDPASGESVLLERQGDMNVWSIQRPANRGTGNNSVIRHFRLMLKRCGFDPEFIVRVETCLAEEVPNAMRYAPPGTNVTVTLILEGKRPRRMVELIIDNFLRPGERTSLPRPEAVPRMEDMVFEDHGRGTGITTMLANAMTRILLPGYQLMTIMRFYEHDQL